MQRSIGSTGFLHSPVVSFLIESREAQTGKTASISHADPSSSSKNKLPPKRFGKQQPYTSEAGAAAYNTTGTGCDETQQVFTVEAIGL